MEKVKILKKDWLSNRAKASHECKGIGNTIPTF